MVWPHCVCTSVAGQLLDHRSGLSSCAPHINWTWLSRQPPILQPNTFRSSRLVMCVDQGQVGLLHKGRMNQFFVWWIQENGYNKFTGQKTGKSTSLHGLAGVLVFWPSALILKIVKRRPFIHVHCTYLPTYGRPGCQAMYPWKKTHS